MGRMKSIISAPEKIKKSHITTNFDCGNSTLNTWLQDFAYQKQKTNETITFVSCCEKNVIAYYSLSVGAIEHQHATPRIIKKLARYSIPVMVITRLAVDQKYQGQNISKGLLKDAIYRTLIAAGHAGMKAILVHANDEDASKFYQKFDFEPCPIDPFKLMLSLKDARKFFKVSSYFGPQKRSKRRTKKRTK
jgi:GNAT superfamily N-acetyltransferase